MNPPTEADIAWARALTDARMASDLEQLALNVRFHTPSQRTALLGEAAHRIRTGKRS